MRSTYLGLALLSATAMAFEITLTRLFSVTQWYHFAFLAVSVALLGYGASGTALSLVPRWANPPTARRTATLTVLFAVSVVGAYLSLNHLPFDSYRIAWERVQLLYLVLYYLALTVPFFCAGLVTGLLLTAHAEQAATLYAANLLGSAFGGLVPVLALPHVGEGTVLVIAALGFLAAAIFVYPVPTTGRKLLLLAVCVLLLCLAYMLPAPFKLVLSPYKGLSQVLLFPDAEVVWQQWNAFSRVDRVRSSAIRSAPGLSLSYPGRLPVQDGVFVDGDDLSPAMQTADGGGFTAYLPVALPYQLRSGARALVLGARSGLYVWTALNQGAASVVAVEGNPLLVEAAGDVYLDARVQVDTEEGRSYAQRSNETFDVVHLALGDGYRPVTSGAYSLGERYDLTVEAFEDYWARLRPGGLLVVERWLQLPPSEMLRAGATVIEALRRVGVRDPAAQMAVIRDWQIGLILVKNGTFTEAELAAIREFSRARSLDLVALPGLDESEANLYNVLEEPVYFDAFRQLLVDPEAVYRTQTYNVRPTHDGQPFFFHFFKWGQTRDVLQKLGRTWQPWGGSGYFVLVALLAVAAVASAALILVPLAFLEKDGRKGSRRGPRGRTLAYFGLLGFGFLFVEIPLMQRFILFLDQPIYAFTAVVAAMLLSSGLGSLAAPRLSIRWTLPLLVVVILVYPLGLSFLFRPLLGVSLAARLLVTGLSLAPLGFLMGIPFPGGLAWLRRCAPGLIPWAWAVNGCTSVLASVLAAMIALSAGFSWVLAAAALAYAGAWLVLR
jgi:spermidine synthase